MKITCERCHAEHQVPDAKVPPSGFKMTCPACQNQIVVPPGGQAAAPPAPAGPREIALSSMDDDSVDLPAPAAKSAPAPFAPKPPQEEPDLPAPRKSSPPPFAPPSKSSSGPDVVDLPAPRAKAPPPPPKAPAHDEDIIDLPAPISLDMPGVSIDLPTPVGSGDLPTPVGRADLPRPAGRTDLPTPVGARADSLKPKAPPPIPGRQAPPRPSAPGTFEGDAIGLDLDAPDVDDLPLEQQSAELPTPKMDSGVDLPTPRSDGGVDLPGHRAEDGAELSTSTSEPSRAVAARTGSSASLPDVEAAPAPKSKKKTLVIAGVAVAVLAGGGVVGMKLFAAKNAKQALETRLTAARRAIADDTAPGLRKAVAELKVGDGVVATDEEIAVAAQAHFMLARLGVAGELQAGKALLERPTLAPPSTERHRAEGARDMAAGELAAARKVLREIITAGPDAAAMSYLGWTNLVGRDGNAAKADFSHALQAETPRAQASYGLGLASERLGADPAAKAAYEKVVATVPDHVRARLGLLRIAARAGDGTAGTKIESLLAERAASLTPREQAEGMVALGQIALDNGRTDEAEDRFKKAISLDGEPAQSLVAQEAKLGVARVNLRLGRAAESIDDLKRLVVIDPRGVEPRLVLAEALLDRNDVSGAATILTAAEKLAPKDARIAFLRGRIALAHTTVSNADREEALARFREATAADPKLVAAWAALARCLADLGRGTEAIDALDKAAAGLTADPRGAAQIAEAYLAIGRPADAEVRFRAMLAAQKDRSGPEKLPLWLGLGGALEAQNKVDDAANAYADAQKDAPKSSALLERRGRLALRLNKNADAAAFFDEALKLGTPTVALRVARAELALAAGQNDEARKLAESAQHDDERSASALLILARVEMGSDHLDLALTYARRAATLQDLPGAHLVIAQVSEKMGKLDVALSEYTLAKKPPFTDDATLGHARVLVRQGTTRDALAELQPLLKVPALRGPASLLAGDCYADLQQPDKARLAYGDASKAMPTSGDAAFKLGRAEMDAAHRGPGVTALEHALKVGDPKAPWLADAYLLLGDGHRLAGAKEAAIRAYTKYLEVAPKDAQARTEAVRQITNLGGKPPGSP